MSKKLVLQSAVGYLWLDQEFIYVGDEAIVEPSGQSRRIGIDVSVRYEVLKNLFADFDLSLANPRAAQVAKADSYLPLAPGLQVQAVLLTKKNMDGTAAFVIVLWMTGLQMKIIVLLQKDTL